LIFYVRLTNSPQDFKDDVSATVEEGFVFRTEDYKYSSATDYAGQKGILDKVIVFQYFKL